MRSAGVGRTGVRVSELSFGGAQIGNLYRATGDDEASGAVRAAWRAGIRYFDTAPHYGLGLSERRLGAALRDLPAEGRTVSTKVGRLLVPDPGGASRRDGEGFDVPATLRRVWDFSRDGVLRSVEDSLRRLGLDRIDILYLHDPDDHYAQARDEGFPALADLRDQGVVGAIGAGMNQSAMLTDFVRETDVDVVMLAGRYTLLEQGALDDLLPACQRRGVSVVAVGVFNSGVLARDRPAAGAKYNYDDAPGEVVARAGRIAEICGRYGVSLPEAAVRLPLAHPAVVSVGVGCRSAEQVRRNVALLGAAVPDELWADLVRAGLLRPDTPLPAGPRVEQDGTGSAEPGGASGAEPGGTEGVGDG